MRNDLEEICRIFREKDRFLIACHENPEGDAIGSELALALALRKLGKTATVLNSDPVPGNLVFLPGADTVVFDADGSSCEVAVVVDCGSPERTGRVGTELRKCPIMVNIDHHPTNDAQGDFCLIDPGEVAERVYETRSADRLGLLGRVLGSLELAAGGRVAAITTRKKDLREFSATKDHLEGFINYPRSIAGVEVAAGFREEKAGEIRVSLRSKGRVDVSAVASALGGGGHRNAAGCTVRGSLKEAKRRVFRLLEDALP